MAGATGYRYTFAKNGPADGQSSQESYPLFERMGGDDFVELQVHQFVLVVTYLISNLFAA